MPPRKKVTQPQADLIYSLDYNSEKIIQYYLDILLWLPSIFIPGVIYFMLLLFSQALFIPSACRWWPHLRVWNYQTWASLPSNNSTYNQPIPVSRNWHGNNKFNLNEWMNEPMNQWVPLIPDYFWHFSLCINIWCHVEYVFYDYDRSFQFSRLSCYNILVKRYQFCWFNSASSVFFKWETWIIYVLRYTQRVICSINISNWMKVYSFRKCSSITLSPRRRRKWQPRKQGFCCKNNSYFSSKAFWTSGIWTWQYWKWCIHSVFESLSIYDKTKVDEVKSEGKTKQLPLKQNWQQAFNKKISSPPKTKKLLKNIFLMLWGKKPKYVKMKKIIWG